METPGSEGRRFLQVENGRWTVDVFWELGFWKLTELCLGLEGEQRLRLGTSGQL